MDKQNAWDRILIARHPDRPKAIDFLPLLIDGFIECKGDRVFGDDPALIGGFGYFQGRPVTVLAQCKGRNTSENLYRNFGMMHPEGYRKVQSPHYYPDRYSRSLSGDRC
jgi:acetyl-CoA carboxylase carboxyl transferase subunit alpha